MLTASVLLAILAVLLAWPVPLVLGRAAWPARAPATALVLWQAIALAGGLSMIGALLTFGLIPFGDTLIHSARTFLRQLLNGSAESGADLWHLLALCAAVLLGAHLVSNLILTIVTTERQRHRHRRLIELLAAPDPSRPNTRVLDNAVPVAYCLPGALRSITVFSEGLAEILTPAELRAVIAHEEAHVTQRHDLLLVAFGAWHTSLPWFPIAYRAEREVGTLVEMLADDHARRTVEDRTLAAAIVVVAGGQGNGPAQGAAGGFAEPAMPGATAASTARQTRTRVTRLVQEERPLSVGSRLLVALVAVALVAGPTVLLFAR
jgi:Zn-dependent protease with chaperone function